ncbi:MAG: acetylxylan esterase [Acidobacteriota bacterium]|nr:acetylxylan esterase [Acidobacteriota bacterium]
MTRRELLTIPLAAAAFGQNSDGLFPGTQYRDYSRCLPDFLRTLAAHAYERRNRELEKLITPAAIQRRQKWVGETFWQLVGGKPVDSALHVQQSGSFNRTGYRVEKIVYQSHPEFYVPADVYVPTAADPPFPGVLFQMGHSPNGKAADTYQRCCQGLAKLGYLVLAFDPMGQGERIYYPDASGTHTRLRSADDEHTVPGRQMLLMGETASRMQVWDAIRSLDVLAAHPKVDARRLASMGQSGGGTLTMLLLSVDDRLSAAAVCSGNTENFACANFNPPGSTDDAEQDFVNSGPVGFDRWDLFYPFAPKPLLVTVSDKDSFGTYSSNYIASGWEEYGKLKRAYEILGKPENLAWSDTPLPHGLSYDSRLQVYNWFERHLKGSARKIEEEPAVSPEPDETLWASKTGNVRSLGGQTPFTLLKSRNAAMTPVPLDELVGADRPPVSLRARVLSRVPSRGIEIEAIEVQSANDLWLPAWVFRPRVADAGKPVLVMFDPAGRNVHWHEGEIYQELARKGYVVCVADVRGISDLAPEYSRGAAGYAASHHSEEDYAWASFILGKSMLGQRVTDMLALLAGLRGHRGVEGKKVVLNAKDRLTVPAIFAAAIDRGIDELYLSGGLVSYKSVVEAEHYSTPLSSFCWDVLRHTDLPGIVAGLGSTKVTLAGTVDASGKTLDASIVRRTYGNPKIVIRADPDWSSNAFVIPG